MVKKPYDVDIEINMDNVMIEGQTVNRPDYISRGQWMQQWEIIKSKIRRNCPTCGAYV
jgi:hypothetical protein